jgi:hypothetical protein
VVTPLPASLDFGYLVEVVEKGKPSE